MGAWQRAGMADVVGVVAVEVPTEKLAAASHLPCFSSPAIVRLRPCRRSPSLAPEKDDDQPGRESMASRGRRGAGRGGLPSAWLHLGTKESDPQCSAMRTLFFLVCDWAKIKVDISSYVHEWSWMKQETYYSIDDPPKSHWLWREFRKQVQHCCSQQALSKE